MDYLLKVSPQNFALIWACLGEAPAKAVFPLMTDLKAQVEQQEAKAAQPAAPEQE